MPGHGLGFLGWSVRGPLRTRDGRLRWFATFNCNGHRNCRTARGVENDWPPTRRGSHRSRFDVCCICKRNPILPGASVFMDVDSQTWQMDPEKLERFLTTE